MNRNAATGPVRLNLFNLKDVSTYKKIKYIIVILFIYLTLTVTYDMILGTLSENWAETDGIIIKSMGRADYGKSKESSTDKDYEIKGAGSYHSIKYKYTVNGKQYISNRVSYPHMEYSGQKGESIKVYFWEKFPNFSVIKKGSNMDLSTILLLCVFLVISISVIIADPSNKRSG